MPFHAFRNKTTGDFIVPPDPAATEIFPYSPEDALPGAQSWEEVFATDFESDPIEGFEIVLVEDDDG